MRLSSHRVQLKWLVPVVRLPICGRPRPSCAGIYLACYRIAKDVEAARAYDSLSLARSFWPEVVTQLEVNSSLREGRFLSACIGAADGVGSLSARPGVFGQATGVLSRRAYTRAAAAVWAAGALDPGEELRLLDWPQSHPMPMLDVIV